MLALRLAPLTVEESCMEEAAEKSMEATEARRTKLMVSPSWSQVMLLSSSSLVMGARSRGRSMVDWFCWTGLDWIGLARLGLLSWLGINCYGGFYWEDNLIISRNVTSPFPDC